MGPFTVGDRRVFARTISGTFAKVNVLVLYPDGEVWAFEAYEDTASPGTWLCSDVGTLEYEDWSVIRWNCYTNTTDTLPVKSSEEMFLVRPTAAAQPFYYEV